MRPADNTVAPAPAAAIEPLIGGELLEHAGLTMMSVKAMREHHIHTVDTWTENLESHWDTAVGVISKEAARAWRPYLAWGRLAFSQREMGVNQILLTR